MSDHRIGMIVPSSNLTMETELPRMLRRREEALPEERFTFHSSRMRMKHVTPEELVRMNAQTERASLELADARPDVVASACLVAIMAQGAGYHCHAEGQITGVLQDEGLDVPVLTATGACAKATLSATLLCFGSDTNDAAIVASTHMPHLPALYSARISLKLLADEPGGP